MSAQLKGFLVIAAEYDAPSEALQAGSFRLTGSAMQSMRDTAVERSDARPASGRGQPARPASGWLMATVVRVIAIGGPSPWVGPSAVIGPRHVFTLLAGAYRIYQGQAPSADFSNPIGPPVYRLVAIAIYVFTQNIFHGSIIRCSKRLAGLPCVGTLLEEARSVYS